MAVAISVEKFDKRDGYLETALREEGFKLFEMGEEDKCEGYDMIYVRSLLSEVTAETALKFPSGSMLFARGLSGEVSEIIRSKDIEYYNILEDETFIVKNAYITAEGALAYIIGNTDITIRRMPVLVLGYGRVGKSVTKLLKDNYAVVSVATDNAAEYATSSIFCDEAYTLTDFKAKLADFSVIINTIPKKILEGDTLKLVRKDCFILDLASKPGGLDYVAAEELNIKFLHALGVPGKIAPKTAGLYIKEVLMKRINKRL